MKISTKGRYGIKAMLELALNNNAGHISINEIAQRQNISENYLEQIFAALKKAGLIKSIRGSRGGYTLAMEPSEISIGEILRALEGSLAPVDCVKEENPAYCSNSQFCVTRVVWERVRDSINNVVESITLGDLVMECRKLENSDSCYLQT